MPHFPLHALPQDIEKYRGRYDAGWDAIREQRYKRQREMGVMDCALVLPRPEAYPFLECERGEFAGAHRGG